MLAATVRNRRISRVAEGVLALVVLEDDAAQHAVATDDGHEDAGLRRIGPGYRPDPERIGLGARIEDNGFAPEEAARYRTVGTQRRGRKVEALAVLELVEVVDDLRLLVDPANADVAGREDFAELVPDQVHDPLEVEARGDALLNAVDDRELVRALLELLGTLGDLLFEALRPLRIVERDGGLAREHGEEIAVGIVEPAECSRRCRRTDNQATCRARGAA